MKSYVDTKLKELRSQKSISDDELQYFTGAAKRCGYNLNLVKMGVSRGLFSGKVTTILEQVQHKDTVLKPIRPNVAAAAVLKEAKKLSLDQKVELRQYVINKTGRENGPDIALKVLPSIKGNATYTELKEIINENSSITEVMNLLAFLTIKNADKDKCILKDLSIASGTHNDTGEYTNPEAIGTSEEIDSSVFASLKDKDGYFDIVTLKSLVEPASKSADGGDGDNNSVFIPQGILKRDSTTYDVKAFKLDNEKIPLLISACILQMVNILENTRQVFGGWTKLFKEMQGGSSKPKNKSKKTRRRNRRIN